MNLLDLREHVYFTESILKTLKQNRIYTVFDFLQEEAEKLSTLTKLTLPQILEIRQEIFKKHSANLISGTTLFINSLTCKNLDETLGGGIPVGLITEICGLAGCGKTQLCMQLAINSVKESDDSVLYVDTKGDFSAIRLQKILDANGISYKEMAKIMLKIRVVRIWSMEDLIILLENIKSGVLKIENLSLIIVDSLPCLLFQHFGDDNKIGLTFLNRVVNNSRYISKEYQIGIIYVNIQTRWVDQDVSDPEEIESTATVKDNTYTEKRNRCLGKYWQTIPALLLVIEKYSDYNVENNYENCVMIKVMVTRHFNPLVVENCILKLNALGVT
ncbi:DNA repair protein RAD51 homolog 4 [Melitaea cinxia]|uniref:DNA repair protein RAD51 homolog 4 n=1 Tax=Melitaea cinxia TaxID=113334 RepID=UPI001E273559|nr:DNA repair protein RAD51 homolog 4 [Melitaea cinxia]